MAQVLPDNLCDPFPSVLIDADHGLFSWNQAAEQAFGWSEEDAKRNYADIFGDLLRLLFHLSDQYKGECLYAPFWPIRHRSLGVVLSTVSCRPHPGFGGWLRVVFSPLQSPTSCCLEGVLVGPDGSIFNTSSEWLLSQFPSSAPLRWDDIISTRDGTFVSPSTLCSESSPRSFHLAMNNSAKTSCRAFTSPVFVGYSKRVATLIFFEVPSRLQDVSIAGLALFSFDISSGVISANNYWAERYLAANDSERISVDRLMRSSDRDKFFEWCVSDSDVLDIQLTNTVNTQLCLRIFRLPSSSPTLVHFTACNITDLQTVNQTLMEERENAHNLAELKGELLATMSHEIRGYLNGMIGMVELLRETSLSGEQRQYAETAQASGTALRDLINNVLDYSKIEAGKMTLEEKPMSLLSVSEDVVDILADQAQAKGLEISLVPSRDLPANVVGDPGRLRQILMNLLSNAVKFTDRGEVTVELSARAVPQQSHTAEFTIQIKDTGSGIAADRIDQLFQPFSQLGSTAHRAGGTGLGLVIMKRLVELMNGSVMVSSVLGEGTTFSVKVQLAVLAAPDAIPLSSETSLQRRLAETVTLIMEPNASAARAIEVRMRTLGCSRVTIVTDCSSPSLMLVPNMLLFISSSLPPAQLLETLLVAKQSNCAVILLRPLRGQPTIDISLTSATAQKPVRTTTLVEILNRILLGITTSPVVKDHSPLGTRLATPGKPIVSLSTKRASRIRNKLPPQRPLHILLVEDDMVNQCVAVQCLRKLGHSVEAVGNGMQAVESVRKRPYEVVLMDCHMPEMDGYTATTLIRELPTQVANVPIVALTGSALDSDREKCITCGMDDFLAKPFDLAAIHAVLERVIEMIDERSGMTATTNRSDSAPTSRRASALAGYGHNPMSAFDLSSAFSSRTDLASGSHSASPLPSSGGELPTFVIGSGTMVVPLEAKVNSLPALDPSVIEMLEASSEGDTSLVKDIIDSFLANLPTYCSEIILVESSTSATPPSRITSFANAAHKLKGASGSIGCTALSSLCGELEKMSRQDSRMPGLETVQLFEAEVDRAKQALLASRNAL